jgi:hypothetical protein
MQVRLWSLSCAPVKCCSNCQTWRNNVGRAGEELRRGGRPAPDWRRRLQVSSFSHVPSLHSSQIDTSLSLWRTLLPSAYQKPLTRVSDCHDFVLAQKYPLSVWHYYCLQDLHHVVDSTTVVESPLAISQLATSFPIIFLLTTLYSDRYGW